MFTAPNASWVACGEVAILNFQGPLPEGVRVALSLADEPRVPSTWLGRGMVVEWRHWSGAVEIRLEEDLRGKATPKVTEFNDVWSRGGFEFAPVFSRYGSILSGFLVRDLEASSAPGQLHWRFRSLLEISQGRLDDCVKRLTRREAEFVEALAAVKSRMIAELRKCGSATSTIANELRVKLAGVPGLAVEERLVNELVNVSRPLPDLARCLGRCQKALHDRGDKQGCLTISRLYTTILAATLTPETIKDIRQQMLANERLVVIPSIHHSLVEIFMAGADGRLAEYRVIDGSARELPSGKKSLKASAPDSGIRSASERAMELKHALSDHYKLDRGEFVDTDLLAQINSLLEYDANGDGRVYLVSQGHAASVDVWFSDEMPEKVKALFPGLVLVRKVSPDETAKKSQADALAPWIKGDILPPVEQGS
jgi:hypothetical protein